jgi:hypothetical protein
MANLTAMCNMLGFSSTDINARSPSMSTFGILACIAKRYSRISACGLRDIAACPGGSIPQEKTP